ncbi:uncharacterized protein PAC_15463 [Phialocephala subalpina]|uniref:Carbohydrate esterase family 16 protein n=1 Tax=Phialocephala subalpina TaxID=576137 RepID=A0A1L7XKM3_9HELO|nr:uncharacterized protein PAC_15463 [Phialocephala subalpina]
MRPGSVSPLASALCVASTPGWSGIKHVFIFRDSYTTTGFNVSGIQPTPTNPLGNTTFPGWTAADGPNWVDQLTVKYNASKLLTYNLAYGGATINSALVAPYLPTVSSVAEQIENEWFPAYASKPSTAPWTYSDTLFAIFDGINDVENSWHKGLPATTTLNAEIFAVYHGLVMELYYAGARNFAFLNNEALLDVAACIKDEKPDVNVFTVDANKYFTEVLDKPSSFKQTAQYKNTTAYCVAYEKAGIAQSNNGTPTETYFDASCGVPVNEYFWLNSLHPTYPMQDVLAQEVAAQLISGPNVC